MGKRGRIRIGCGDDKRRETKGDWDMKDPELLKHIIVALWKGKRHYKAEDIEIIEAREVPDLCGSFYIAMTETEN